MNIEVDFQPIGKHVEIDSGTTILEAAQEAGVGISAICGGVGSCGACRVRLDDQEHVSKPNETEIEVLDSDDIASGIRLACQTEIYGPIRVDVPSESMTATQRTQVEGEEISFEFESPIKVLDLTLTKADATDPQADFERLRAAVLTSGWTTLRCDRMNILKQIPGLLRANKWKIRVGLRGDELVSVSAPGTLLLGMAVDIGTTKVAGYLVDMASGETLAIKGIMNPQIVYGEDVMARITYSLMHENGSGILQKAIIDALNKLAIDLCAAAGADGDTDTSVYVPTQIVESVMVGNTAMHHLLLGLPVKQLGLSPYVAAVSSPLDVKADEIDLAFSPGATVHLLANIAGFVGADHLSMLLATDTHKKKGVVISLDIGTNTEITLVSHGRMIACSTASGPAFEGAHIHHGMRAADGAIERVQIVDNKLAFQTIGHTAPVGVCGSGILDAIAQLKLCGAMNDKGALDVKHPLIREGKKLPEALLAAAAISGNGHDIVLSRSDINEIQLAKGAMRAGIELLLDAAGVTAADVDEFIIAGAFGSYISVEAAVGIGMFPDIPIDRFRQVGNAAGIGAKQALLSTTRRAEAAGIGERVEYLELTVSEKFQAEFLKALYM
ncbi:ASKHA domain-containing protein [Desulfobacula sp.]|uniref:ASKHA domain-containing protein n=1 Tax=Desulfobacula sp. TaxID=2593537 RepID=UPI00260A3AF7|nr:ASKHA domain-containing protein [Desulfobacula sp.]